MKCGILILSVGALSQLSAHPSIEHIELGVTHLQSVLIASVLLFGVVLVGLKIKAKAPK